MEEITGITVVGGLFASKDILLKLLGPTADYLGDCGRHLVQKGHDNLSNILRVTCAKLGSEINRPGQVNPRVFKNVFDEGRFIEDAFSAEYFGGITAAARTPDGKDDSALPWVALVKSLSSLQIRLHFTVYSLFARVPHELSNSVDPVPITDLELRVTAKEMLNALELDGPDSAAKFTWAAQGLIDNDLLSTESAWRIGDMTRNRKRSFAADELILLRGTDRGGVLFLRALGLKGLHPEIIPNVNVDYSLTDAIKDAQRLPEGVVCRHRPLKDPFAKLSQQVENKLSSLEGEIDEVKMTVDDYEAKIEELQNAIDEQTTASE